MCNLQYMLEVNQCTLAGTLKLLGAGWVGEIFTTLICAKRKNGKTAHGPPHRGKRPRIAVIDSGGEWGDGAWCSNHSNCAPPALSRVRIGLVPHGNVASVAVDPLTSISWEQWSS